VWDIIKLGEWRSTLFPLLQVRHDAQKSPYTNNNPVRVQLFNPQFFIGREKLGIDKGKHNGSETVVGIFEANNSNDLNQWFDNSRV
jgi:hypothetical protein